jgi:signal transduction histidine kinase
MNVFDLSINVIEIVITCYFIFNYFSLNKKYSNRIGIIFFVLLLVELSLSNYFTVFSEAGTLIHSFIIFGFTIIFAKNSLVEKVFVSIFVMMINLLSNMLAIIFVELIFGLEFTFLIQNSYFTLAIILSKVIFAILSYTIVKVRNNNKFDIDTKEWIIFIIISLITIFVEINLVGILFNGDYSEQGIIIIILLVLVNIVLMYFIFVKIQIVSTKRSQEKLELLNLKTQKDLHNEVVKNNTEIKKIRHDLKHELNIVKGYLENNDVNTALISLSNYEKHYEVLASSVYTGNYIIDYIINDKVTIANKSSIKVYTVIEKLIINIDIDEFGILLSNLMDNAIENCNNLNPEIKLSVKERNKCIVIEIENSISESVLKNNYLLKSNRGIGHGFGIVSIKNIVKKYKGIINYFERNGLFVVSVVIENQVN